MDKPRGDGLWRLIPTPSASSDRKGGIVGLGLTKHRPAKCEHQHARAMKHMEHDARGINHLLPWTNVEVLVEDLHER